jgi:hypothetical protein
MALSSLESAEWARPTCDPGNSALRPSGSRSRCGTVATIGSFRFCRELDSIPPTRDGDRLAIAANDLQRPESQTGNRAGEATLGLTITSRAAPVTAP